MASDPVTSPKAPLPPEPCVLPSKWVTAGSNDRLWGEAGTYKAIPVDALPAIAGPLDGSFTWLAEAPKSPDGMTFGSDAEEKRKPDDPLEALIAEAARGGLTIPAAFVTLMVSSDLHARIPSCTACYFSLGARLVPIPGHQGPERLLRFMNDQQACFLWYLLLEPGGRHRVVVAAPAWNEEASGPALEDVADPTDVAICAASFEEFIKRFWIENTLWFADSNEETFTGELLAYADAATHAIASGLVPG